MSEPPARAGWREWMDHNRSSPRLAFVLRCGAMLLGTLLSLLWARVLVRALGDEVYGIFLAFLAIIQLGGLSELGLAGAVGIHVLNLLSKGDPEACRKFLTTARGVVLAASGAILVLGLALVPWAPRWLGFHEIPGTGSLSGLFMVGALAVALGLLHSYVQNLTYVSGNVVWPIVPMFILTQAAAVAQLMLALRGAPLWAQLLASMIITGSSTVVLWFMLRRTHPVLAEVLPMRFDFGTALSLSTTSLWVFLSAVGNLIYLTTDRIVINSALGPGLLPSYRFNYRICELFAMLLAGASFVGIPALAGRILNPDPAVQAHGLSGLERLRKFQTLACCAIGLLYLGANDLFISLWIGPQYHASLLLQCCFALNFVVTISGDVCIQLPGRLDHAGARMAGGWTALCGVLNLGLSLLAARQQSLVGVAVATIVAQSVYTWIMIFYTAGRLKQTPWIWIIQSWVIPILVIVAGGWICQVLRPLNFTNASLYAGASLVLIVTVAVCERLTVSMLKEELGRFLPRFGAGRGR